MARHKCYSPSSWMAFPPIVVKCTNIERYHVVPTVLYNTPHSLWAQFLLILISFHLPIWILVMLPLCVDKALLIIFCADGGKLYMINSLIIVNNHYNWYFPPISKIWRGMMSQRILNKLRLSLKTILLTMRNKCNNKYVMMSWHSREWFKMTHHSCRIVNLNRHHQLKKN